MKVPKLLHATRWLSLFEIDGWIYASRRKPNQPGAVDALNLIALHEEDGRRRLVVIEEWRKPLQTWEFALPAGLVESGEELATCGERELQEETGLKVTWTGPRSGRLFSSAGLTDESFAYGFFGCTGEPALNPGVEGERIHVHLLDRAGCRELLQRNQDGTALSGRLWPVLFSISETGRIGSYEIP